MKTPTLRPSAYYPLLALFIAGQLAFLPSIQGQVAQAGATAQVIGQRQLLRAHVPAAANRLQPVGRVAGTKRLNLAIGLPLRNPEALAQLLKELRDPGHPNYRHYLTPEEFAARFGPTAQDYAAVAAFAQANELSVTGIHANRVLLDVSGETAVVERAMHVNLRTYEHPTEARTFYAPDVAPSLDLAVPVLGINGLDNYALPRPRLQATPLDSEASVPPAVRPNAGSGPSGTYMGNDFRAAYVPNTPMNGAGQSVGLLQFDGYTASDITDYETRAGLPNVPLVNVLVDGASGRPTGSGGEVEVSLDIEMAISMAPGLSTVFVYMAPNPSPFVDLLNRMATDNLAKQLSCSWYMPGGGVDAVADQIFQQMAAQGQSFFNASGDYDAFTGPVDFPGETPYIVQVGGTTLTTSGPGGAWVSEKVWNWNNGIGSGGGISTRYAIPTYQADISMALNQGSTTMRNIPDVALTADNIYVRANGRDYNVAGTSCSAPLWAGFSALVNQQAVASGRPVVGFINPAVDDIGHAPGYTSCFHDITVGDNTRSGSPTRFYAVPGYDLCTGWGTPAGQNLITALATPDSLLVTPAALAFGGNVGGPFSPNPGWLSFTNSGTNGLSWTLVNTSGWFNVSPTSGTLLPGGPADSVSASVNASGNSLSPGVYAAVLAITNQTSGVAQTRSLALSVAAQSMEDDFEPDLDLPQWSAFSGVVGSTILATNYGGSVSGSNSLWFGNEGSRFATTVPINTTGGGQIGFCVRLANGPAWPWARPDSLPAEGVVLECSTDGGGSWTALGSYDTSAYYNWTGVALPIPAAARGPAVIFRWRQPSSSGTNYDHWALDNVIVGTGSMAPRIVLDPQDTRAAVGDPASLSVAAVGIPALSYLWMKDGTNVAGATTSSLNWPSVQLSDAGRYQAFLSNTIGSVTSLSATLTVYAPVCVTPPPGLISWWQGEGNALDEAGLNNGTLVGNTYYGAGRVGQGFVFDGSGDAVMVGNQAVLQTSDLTIEAWIKRASTALTSYGSGGNGIIFGYGSGGYGLYLDRDGRPALTKVAINEVKPNVTITDTNLHHLAVTKNSSNVVFYVDGVAYPASAYDPGFVFSTSAAIGARGDTRDNSFLGTVDEVAVYARGLSGTEVQAIYAAGKAGKCATPIPPFIGTQPGDQAVAVGGTAHFEVSASGTPPLFYQWRRDGSPLVDQTNSALVLPVTSTNQAGLYSVVVSNSADSTLSSNALLTVVLPGGCMPPPSGLVSWWKGETDASDQYGTNNGVLYGNTTFGSGVVGNGFVFDGSGDGVRVGNSQTLQMQDLTIEAWVKRASSTITSYGSSGNAIIFGYGSGGYGFYLAPDGRPSFTHIPYDEVRPNVVVTDTNFHHLAVTKGGSTVVFYVDGVAYSAGSYNPTFTFSTQAAIGARGDNLDNSFLGTVDEVSIYSRPLSASEIQAIYAAGSVGKCLPGTPPRITFQPADQSVLLGQPAAFSVGAVGTAPLLYQWRLNGSALAGETKSDLAFTITATNQAGLYSVVVSNDYGWTLSSNAVLNITLPPFCASPPAGLISWWKAEGNPVDQVGTNNGTLGGNTTYGPGRVGQAFVFDGMGDSVNVGNPANLRVQDLTIEAWVKRASSSFTSYGSGGNGIIFGYGVGGYGLYLDPTGHPALTKVEINEVKPTKAVTDTSFHHLAVTKSGSTVVFYVDGVAYAAAAYNPGFTFSTPAAVGARGDGADNSFLGTVDEVAVFNRALTPGEIQAIYSAGSAGKCGLPPFIEVPPFSQTVELSSNATFSVTASGLSPLTFCWYSGSNFITASTNAWLTLTNVGFAHGGEYSVVVTNIYGCATGGPATLTVVDTISPTILSCASNRTFSAGANCNATLPDLTPEVMATDASGQVSVSQTPPPGALLNLGPTNVAFSVKDSSGNSSACNTSITVADTTPPFVTASVVEITVNFDTNCQALLPDLTGTNYVVASDNCSQVSVTQVPPANTALPAGTNTVLLTVSDSASNQVSRAVAVIVPGEPRIAVPPLALSVTVTSNATFSVLACGATPLLCQWQHASTNLLDRTNAILSLTNVKTNDAGEYRVIINNPAGTITSTVARLTVLQPPVITRQPRSVVAAPGATVSFSVTAKGLAPLAYQWQQNGVALESQTRSSLTVTNLQAANFTGYTVGITNGDGGVLSDVAMPTLAASPILGFIGFNYSTFTLTIPTELGPTYVLECKDSLEETNWKVVATVSGTGSPIPVSDNGLTNAMRFYRIRVR